MSDAAGGRMRRVRRATFIIYLTSVRTSIILVHAAPPSGYEHTLRLLAFVDPFRTFVLSQVVYFIL